MSPTTARSEDARIYTDLMHKNGLPHGLFGDRDTALAWLLDAKSKGP